MKSPLHIAAEEFMAEYDKVTKVVALPETQKVAENLRKAIKEQPEIVNIDWILNTVTVIACGLAVWALSYIIINIPNWITHG
jgi:hypothetical protein